MIHEAHTRVIVLRSMRNKATSLRSHCLWDSATICNDVIISFLPGNREEKEKGKTETDEETVPVGLDIVRIEDEGHKQGGGGFVYNFLVSAPVKNVVLTFLFTVTRKRRYVGRLWREKQLWEMLSSRYMSIVVYTLQETHEIVSCTEVFFLHVAIS